MNYLILINKDNKIKNSFYKYLKLVDAKDVDRNTCQVEESTYKNYLELKEYLEKKNIIVGIDSSYRNLEKQQEIMDDYVIKYGKEYANSFVAPVGASEHHTGLAIDLDIFYRDHFLIDNNELMQHEDLYLEIHQYLAQFGFILRYPKGKEEITGYPYEPWHIRYVGKLVANIIYQNNWTLEEYLNNFSGVLLINKEPDMTSRDVVNEISHLFGIKKVGHTGTLDPIAEGVLVVTIGKATKIGELLTATDKEYQAKVKLGIKTDTLDITGNIIKTVKVPENINIENTLSTFKKTYLQEVPIYSAVKVKGKKLYEYARSNQEVNLPKKEVTIKDIELLEKSKDYFTFKCLVTKGCYIRSLINDIATSLNTCATMTELIRTKQGRFNINDTYKLQDIKENKYKLLSIEESLPYKVIEVDDILYKKISTGQKIDNIFNIEDKVIFKYQNKIIGIYQKESNYLKTWKNFI